MKKYTVVFSPLAFEDAEAAIAQYENIQTGLGKRFNEQLQAALLTINRNPLFASFRYASIRCAQVKRFPYLIHYYVNETELLVTITAVYPTSKEPFW
jgi:toxin ParE1/3/4